jgi:glycosyltransferase involved in cell wall biosynthesis
MSYQPVIVSVIEDEINKTIWQTVFRNEQGFRVSSRQFLTPFFNTEKYLAECIESVVRQTYQNWDYVLVNNRSTDGSVRIAEKYAKQFPARVRIEHNSEFLSQVQNYDHALRFISPESRYCKVVQADDWLFPECVKSMVAVAEAHPTVGIVAAYELEGDKVRLDACRIPVRRYRAGNLPSLFS